MGAPGETPHPFFTDRASAPASIASISKGPSAIALFALALVGAVVGAGAIAAYRRPEAEAEGVPPTDRPPPPPRVPTDRPPPPLPATARAPVALPAPAPTPVIVPETAEIERLREILENVRASNASRRRAARALVPYVAEPAQRAQFQAHVRDPDERVASIVRTAIRDADQVAAGIRPPF